MAARLARFQMWGFVGLAGALTWVSPALALDLDWSGQFRAEAHWLHDYSMDESATGLTRDAARDGLGGYYIPGGGSREAYFQTLFLRLRPKVVVNDNIYLKTEWWLGDPVYGFFGDAFPYARDQRQFGSTYSRGSTITAQRFWAEFLSDVGTLQLGRAPLHWGLGVVWNSGDGMWDRYQSTGDVIRLVSKFGLFSFTPSIIKYSMGNNVGGACSVAGGTPVCPSSIGGGGVSDYSIQFKYDDPEEDFEGGVNFIKRIAGASQDPASGILGIGTVSGGQVPAGMNFNTWDLYGRKKLGRFALGGEIPITTGDLGGMRYETFAVALEASWDPSDSWEATVRAGRAPGHPSFTGDRPDKFRAFYFNPNYKLGLIMFNYQLASMAGPNTQNNPVLATGSLVSPFDNPIANANYLAVGGGFKTEKWRFHTNWVFARALETATAGMNFFNTWERRFRTNGAGVTQSTSLGWEMDWGLSFKWDDNFLFAWDFGWFFPGDYFAFSNTATPNVVSAVFGTALKVGVTF